MKFFIKSQKGLSSLYEHVFTKDSIFINESKGLTV